MPGLHSAIALMNRNPDVRHVITTAVIPDPDNVLRFKAEHLPGFESGLRYCNDTAFKVGRPLQPKFLAGGRPEEALEAERKNADRLSAIRHNRSLHNHQSKVYYSKVGFVHKENVSDYLARRPDLFHATYDYDEVGREQKGVLALGPGVAVLFPASEIAGNLVQIKVKAKEHYFAYGYDGVSPAPLLSVPDAVSMVCEDFLRCMEDPFVKQKIFSVIGASFRDDALR